MSIFDDLLNANKKRKDNNGDRNTTGNTVQAQAQQQTKNVEPKQNTSLDRKPNQYQQLVNIAKSMAGGSLGSAKKKSSTITNTADEIARAKQLNEIRAERFQNSKGGLFGHRNAEARLAMKMLGQDPNSAYDGDAYKDFLKSDKDNNFINRTVNDIQSGFNQWTSGLEGTSLAISDAINKATGSTPSQNAVEDQLKDIEYSKALAENAISKTPQNMYDRVVANVANNGLNALETAAFMGLGGASLGTNAAENIGKGVMGLNSFGSSYGDVRTGRMGDQYANDLGAATRFALANAGSELAQELIPGGFIPGADIPSIGNFTGEMVQEGFGGILDPYLNTVLDYDPLTQTGDWAKAMLDTAIGQHTDENGNYSLNATKQRLGNIGQQALEGGIGGWAGGLASNPYQTIRQAGTDIKAIKNDVALRRATKNYENATNEGGVATQREMPVMGELALAKDLGDFSGKKWNKDGSPTKEYNDFLRQFDSRRQYHTNSEVLNYDGDGKLENALKNYDSAIAEGNVADSMFGGDNEIAREANDRAEAALNDMRYVISNGALRSSVKGVRERAQRANETIIRHDAEMYKVDISEESLNNIIKISNNIGIPVDFLPKEQIEKENAGAWFAPGRGGNFELETGVIHLPNAPIIKGEPLESTFMHEVMHTLEGTPEYFKLAKELKKIDEIYYEAEGGKGRTVGTFDDYMNSAADFGDYFDYYAYDQRKMHGTEHYANLLGNFAAYTSGIDDFANYELTENNKTQKDRTITKVKGKTLEAMRASKYVTPYERLLYDPRGLEQLSDAVYRTKDMLMGDNKKLPENWRDMPVLGYDDITIGEAYGMISNHKRVPYNGVREYITPHAPVTTRGSDPFDDYAFGLLPNTGEATQTYREGRLYRDKTSRYYQDLGSGLTSKDLDLISQAIQANDEEVDNDLKDRLVNQFGYDELANASLDDIWNMYVDHQNGQTEGNEFVGTEENKFGLDEEGLKMLSDEIKANDEQIDYDVMNKLADAGYDGVLDGNPQQLWNIYTDYQKKVDKQATRGMSEATFNNLVRDLLHRDTTSTVNKNAEGTRYIVGPDGVFAGQTVNDLYQSILEDITTLKNQDREQKFESINRELEALGVNKGRAATAPVTIDELANAILDGRKKEINSFINRAAGLIHTETGITQEEAEKRLRQIADKYKANPRIAELNRMAYELKKNGGKTDKKGKPESKTLKDLGYKVLTDMHQKVITDEYERHDAAIDEIEFGMDNLTPEERAKKSREIMVKKPEDQKINYVETSEGGKIPVQDFSHKQLEETKDEADFNKKISKKYTAETKGEAGEWGKNESNEAALDYYEEKLRKDKNFKLENVPENLRYELQARLDRQSKGTKAKTKQKTVAQKETTAETTAETTSEQNGESLHDIIMRFHESGESDEFKSYSKEQQAEIEEEINAVVDEIENPTKLTQKREQASNLNSTLALIYFRAGATEAHANALAKNIMETGKASGYADVLTDLKNKGVDETAAREFLTRTNKQAKKANYGPSEEVTLTEDMKMGEKAEPLYTEGSESYKTKTGRLVKGDVTIASKNAEKAIKAVKEITGKEYTDEQKEAVRSAYEEFERITEEANKQAFETYQESQRQFQQKVAEEAQQARINDRVMAEEQQASQETEQVQQTQQETKQEQKKAETPKQEIGKKGDTSPHATVARLLKSKTLSKTVRDILKRDYVEKPVKHDRTVFGEAEELLQESGIEGAVAYANSVQPGSYFGEEAQAYLNEALVRLNAKAVDLETAIGKMDKNDPDYKTLKDLQKTYEDQSVQLCDKLLENASEAGRVVRIMRFLKGNPKLTRTYVEKLVDKLNKQYEKELNGKKLIISEDALNAYANAKTDDERAKAMDKIQYEVADQMPRNAWDMIRQWRMTSMLLNPKTHARNLISNGLTYWLFGTSDLAQIGIERGLKATGIIKDSDMRAAITSKEMRKAAKWLDTRDKYSYEGPQSDKFNLNQGKLAAGAFHNTNAIGRSLNKVSKLNSRLLEAEDKFFVGARAHLALAESLTAQGYSVTKEGDGWKITDKNGEKINDKVLKAMEQEALKSAQEATYHDFNKTAKAIEDFKKNAGIAGKAVDIVVPFTKTPANILRRSIEFSPVGLAKSVTWNLAQVKQGKMSASTAITQMSRGLTGTAMFALGALLANMGNLSEPEDDEDKTAYYKSNIFGKQDLALHIGDNYYSIDWAMPTASPLMMGATMANTFREHGLNILDYDLKDVLKESAKAINPVLEASYLGSLNDFVTSIAQGINYDGELMPAGALGAGERAVESVAENFVGQLTPTVGGAINRTIDSTKRTTSGNTMLERMKNRSLMNIPGMSGKLEPAIDQKGQEIENFDFGLGGLGRLIYNMAVPATITTDTHDELDNKLMEAGEKAMPLTQTGSGGLKSKIASDKTLKEAGIDLKNVSGKDYTQVKKTYYGNYRDYVKDYNELAEYNNLGTDTRDNVYGKLSNLALAESKAELLKGVGDTNDLYTDEQKAALAAKEMGVTPAQFFLMKDCGLTGNRRALYVLSELESLGVADQVYQNLLDGKTKTTAWGLTDSVLAKTADERETARAKYLEDDGQTLESMAADYRKNGKKEEETEEPTSTLAEALEKKNNKSTSKGSRKRSSGGSSSSSSISASEKAMLKLYEQILKAGTTNSAGSDIKASVSAKKASDLAAWDKVFNSEKSNVEKLRKELKL